MVCALCALWYGECGVQECLRYNRLISVMASSLSSVQKALKGLVVMSTELDELGTSLYNQKVPAMWEVRRQRDTAVTLSAAAAAAAAVLELLLR